MNSNFKQFYVTLIKARNIKYNRQLKKSLCVKSNIVEREHFEQSIFLESIGIVAVGRRFKNTYAQKWGLCWTAALCVDSKVK